MKRSQHGYFVNGDVAKTGDKLSLHAVFVRKSVLDLLLSVYAAMSLLKLFQVQGINPKFESVITSDYMLLTYKIK